MANDIKPVLVPVQLQLYMYDSRVYVGDSPALPSPITQPDYRRLQLNSSLIQHDIFDNIHVRLSDLNVMLLPSRMVAMPGYPIKWNDLGFRSGHFLHWSIPAAYRTGITASSSANDTQEQRKLAQGFPSTSQASASQSMPAFRPIPDRWLIIRHLDAGTCGTTKATGVGWGQRMSEEYKFFVVESNRVRGINSIDPKEDIVLTSSPYLDPNLPLDQQGENFLGQTHRLSDWKGDLAGDPKDQDHVPVTVLRTGNPYFADYQLQNSSVFSFYDDLTIRPGDVDYDPTEVKQSDGGTVSYTVIGYHSVADQDPLIINPQAQSPPSHEQRLKDCNMEIKGKEGLTSHDFNWLSSSQGTNMRVLCHGNLHNIVVDADPADMKYPANEAQRAIQSSHPISVGTNPIDALLGWIRAQTGAGLTPTSQPTAKPDLVADEDIDAVERQLKKLQSWIQSVSDDPDAQLEAADLIATNNYLPTAGGSTWHVQTDAAATSPAISTSNLKKLASDLQTLRRINLNQNFLNAYLQESKRLKLDLFGEWWKYVVDRDRGRVKEQQTRRKTATGNVQSIITRLKQLGSGSQQGSMIGGLAQSISHDCGTIKCKEGVRPPFYIQRDPTLLFAGVPSNQDNNLVGKNLPVRLDGQETLGRGDPSTRPEMASWVRMGTEFAKEIHGKVPADFEKPMKNLVAELPWISANQAGTVAPYGFLDGGRWDGSNGWFPLFFEWSAEYYHIPYSEWDFAPRGPEAKVQYGIKQGTDLSSTPNLDYVALSGRSPILPQVSASLRTILKQLFSKMNPTELDQLLPEADRQPLLDSATDLQYISAAMQGFTKQLVTRMQGTHVTPNSRPDGGTPTV